MTLAGIELCYLVKEISKKTLDYYVSNIYGINRNSLLFKLHHPKKPDVLLMFSTLGLWLTSVKIDQIEQNKMLKRLRNDLLRLKLTKIEQLGAERIAYLTFSNDEKEFVLVGEFFGDGNIILCNKEMKVLSLLHSIDVRHRRIYVGKQYEPPPQNAINIFELRIKDLEEISSASTEAAKWLGRTLGLPKKYSEEIFRYAEIDSKTPGNKLVSSDVTKIFDSVQLIVKKVIEGQHDPIIIKNGDVFDVSPIRLDVDKQCTKVSTFMEGLDSLITKQIVESGKSLQTSEYDKKIAELKNKLEEQKKAILLVQKKSEQIANVARSVSNSVVQGISSIKDPKFSDILKKHNSKIITEKGVTFIQIGDEKIKVNLDSSLPAIASHLFDESKRKSSAIKSIKQLKIKTEKNIEKLSSQSKVAKESVTLSGVRKKNWYERYRWFFTSDGILAIGGRDASSNSAIIRKHLQKNDKVFHAEIYGSPFFILKNSNKSIQPSTLNEIAQATVCFSRAWKETMHGLDAYWVEPNQVKKGAPSGQYLAKGAFVIEGQRNFVNVSTLRLAVGLLKQDTDYLITCGPPTSIKKNCLCYCVIEPSGSEMVDVAKKIKSELVKMNDSAKIISIDDFVRVLPAGKSHVVESELGEQSK